MESVRVLLVDDQQMIRTSFRLILECEPDIAVVGEASDGDSAVEQVFALRPDVVLMDVRMPGTDGVEATRRIVESGAEAQVVMLTTFDLDRHVLDALRAGAVGFLVKDGPAQSLVEAVRMVAAGDAVLSPRVTRRLLDRFARLPQPPVGVASMRLEHLTAREVDVLRALSRGLSNEEIAQELDVSKNTVRTHIAHILEKYHLRDRVQAVILAYDAGLVTPVGYARTVR
ncbi:response regulator [Streptomyces rutgersensis]|uniref:Response regulator n=1 Tax=Streptomyces rutgersensis TaxID=53451 RepID=A0ABX6RWY3_9ACTN|nr:response regulator transcription factor [Streptomyces rutgersensis]QNE84498.1 response regulator [Streptomyces rutgersensis]